MLNIINGKSERTQRVLNELSVQGINSFKLWQGKRESSVIRSINLSHKQIVEDAYNRGLEEVCIAEDDFLGTHKDSWKFFLQNKPKQYDLYLSSVFLGDLDSENRVKSFTGLTLYFVHSKYFPTFLSVPEDKHIDHALSETGGDFRVCNPFTFIQADGISGNTGKWESYGEMFRFRNLFVG